MIIQWRPILYKPPMVRGIMDGIKDVTRRLIKPQPFLDPQGNWRFQPKIGKLWHVGSEEYIRAILADPWNMFSPYGYSPEDGLWIRETWQWEEGFCGAGCYIFAADWKNQEPMTWRPSIHMPKEACRLFQQVISVRPERLHEITDEDAIREGIERARWADDCIVYKDYLADASGYGDPKVDWPATSYPRYSYQTLWDWINGEGGFESNPWVWRIEAKITERPENF